MCLEVTFHFAYLVVGHEGMRIDLVNPALQPVGFVPGDNGHKDIHFFTAVDARALPFGAAPVQFIGDDGADFRGMGEDDRGNFYSCLLYTSDAADD